MKVLLVAINAKYIHSNLAVHSLAKFANEYREYVQIGEYTINNQMDSVIRDIYEKAPDVLMFSCYVWNIEYVKDIAREFHKIRQEVDIWFGGPEVSFDGPVLLKSNPWLKGVIIGEGERTFERLMRYYVNCRASQSSDLQNINGIMYKDGQKIITTSDAELMPMDDVRFVYDDLNGFTNKIVYYESSRGCPFRCSYCMSSIDKTVRFRSMELVKQELKYFLENKVPQVKFIDRTFNIQVDRTMEILEFLYENDNGVTNFHFEVAADIITDEEVELLGKMRPGYIQLEIGVQSTNRETIEEIERRMDFVKVSQVAQKLLKNNNMHIHLDLIAGLPKEDMESFKKSFNDVYSLHPHELQLGFLKVLKGAKMHDKAAEYGLIYGDKAPYEVLKTKWLGFDDIIKLKAVEEVLEVYYNSGLFPYTIRFLEKYFKSPYDMYEQLATYYKENNLLDMHHTRITRYKILLDFVRTKKNVDICVTGQILLLDLYLRENLKTRPEFAMEAEKYKEITRDYYRQYSKESKSKIFHIEPFAIDVLELMKTGQVKERDCLIVFDYENKHPITKMAAVDEIIGE